MDIEPYYKSSVGRKPGLVHYNFVKYNQQEYVIATIQNKGVDVNFIVDKDDYEKIIKFSWHITANNYISATYYVWIDDKKIVKVLYLHNLIMNRDAFNGKGQMETVDHINRIGFDNRKENLRIISQTEQNINQCKKKRNVILPEGFPINPNDIPRHIWYVRANGLHGDRFAIEFKTEGIVWKTTSSKAVSITDKLNEAKNKLLELYEIYPHLNPSKHENEMVALEKSYAEIMKLI
jgi:hypothetical protein